MIWQLFARWCRYIFAGFRIMKIWCPTWNQTIIGFSIYFYRISPVSVLFTMLQMVIIISFPVFYISVWMMYDKVWSSDKCFLVRKLSTLCSIHKFVSLFYIQDVYNITNVLTCYIVELIFEIPVSNDFTFDRVSCYSVDCLIPYWNIQNNEE